jgi:hypothetical protein
MNNAVYGKTIENVLKRQDIKFCSERKKALKYVRKINFNHETIFTKNLVALHMTRMQVKYNKTGESGFKVVVGFYKVRDILPSSVIHLWNQGINTTFDHFQSEPDHFWPIPDRSGQHQHVTHS